MNNSIPTVSFTGSIITTTWKRGEYVYKEYKTSEFQDKLVRMVAEEMAPPDEVKILSKREAKFFHSLLEYVMGARIPNIKNEKVLYHNSKDQVVFTDREARLLGGVQVELNY